jgi:DNA-directed RNA polymerase subunit RPC12/RpoP
MEESIKCPNCGSIQLSADKKGFSGKKAVAGAVLIGEVGILAGTIGSNKTIITCLKCGNQFKPGEDLEAKKKKDLQIQELNKRVSNSKAFKLISKLLFGLLAIMIVTIILLTILEK